ncbi:hypothetical protein MJT46_019053 [Ovis ammon polii x Ovis aries]|nr:hypothetical protein MJT46_019053 [Ovis ammon polii x Ovis aries]
MCSGSEVEGEDDEESSSRNGAQAHGVSSFLVFEQHNPMSLWGQEGNYKQRNHALHKVLVMKTSEEKKYKESNGRVPQISSRGTRRDTEPLAPTQEGGPAQGTRERTRGALNVVDEDSPEAPTSTVQHHQHEIYEQEAALEKELNRFRLERQLLGDASLNTGAKAGLWSDYRLPLPVKNILHISAKTAVCPSGLAAPPSFPTSGSGMPHQEQQLRFPDVRYS